MGVDPDQVDITKFGQWNQLFFKLLDNADLWQFHQVEIAGMEIDYQIGVGF